MAGDAAACARILDDAPEGWEALVAEDPNATPAHRAVVVRTLAAVLPGFTARFVAVESGGALVGGAPVCIERRSAFTWLHAMPFLLPGAPLARPGHRPAVDRAVADALSLLAGDTGVLGGEWSWYRPADAVDLAVLERVAGETRSASAAVIHVDAGAGLDGRLDRDDRYKLRRARAAGLAWGEEPEAVDAVYALHLAQSRRWPGHRPLALELSRRLLAASHGGVPAARLHVARDARGLASGVLTLEHPREAFLWWSGTRPDARAASASRFLLAAVAEASAARGVSRINLGDSSGRAPLAAFKRSLGARELSYPIRWLSPRATHPAARAMVALQAWARRGRHRGA